MGSSENVLALWPWKAYFLFARDKVWILVLALSVCKDFFREKTHTHTQKQTSAAVRVRGNKQGDISSSTVVNPTIFL